MTHPDHTPAPDPSRYDAVAAQRAIRERISQETAGMTYDELHRYLREHITVPFAPAAPTRTAA